MKKKKKKKFPKDKGAMLFAPNSKTCTQYKEKTNQLTNKSKEWDKPLPHVYKMSKHPKDKGYKKGEKK